MTFEEWLKHEKLRYGIYAIDNSTTLLRDAWDAALAAEREACAKMVEDCTLPDRYSQECLDELAAEIRARRKP